MHSFWRSFLRAIRFERTRPGPRFRAQYVAELPQAPAPWTVYIGRDSDKQVWGGVLRCPCGCEQNIHLNFIRGHDAVWSYRVQKNNVVTISPSIWKKRGCRSHFFIREGMLIWANSFSTPYETD